MGLPIGDWRLPIEDLRIWETGISSIGNRQSPIGNLELTAIMASSRISAKRSNQTALAKRQSAIGNRQSEI
jgi:hypothetical protein